MTINAEITPEARDYLVNLLEKQNTPGMSVRIFVEKAGTPKAETCMAYCPPGEQNPADEVSAFDDLQVYFDAASLPYLQDIKIDLGKTGRWETLTISAPNAKKSQEPSRDIVLAVECTALRVPHGTPTTIPAGGEAHITQALGGSYTINYEGNLYRLDPEQAKKIGLNPNVLMFEPPEDGSISEEQCYEAMMQVYDPEIPVNVVSLGLIYKLNIDQEKKAVNVNMTLTSPSCGMGDVIAADIRDKLSQVPHVDTSDVEVVFDPPWSYDMLSEEGRLELGLM